MYRVIIDPHILDKEIAFSDEKNISSIMTVLDNLRNCTIVKNRKIKETYVERMKLLCLQGTKLDKRLQEFIISKLTNPSEVQDNNEFVLEQHPHEMCSLVRNINKFFEESIDFIITNVPRCEYLAADSDLEYIGLYSFYKTRFYRELQDKNNGPIRGGTKQSVGQVEEKIKNIFEHSSYITIHDPYIITPEIKYVYSKSNKVKKYTGNIDPDAEFNLIWLSEILANSSVSSSPRKTLSLVSVLPADWDFRKVQQAYLETIHKVLIKIEEKYNIKVRIILACPNGSGKPVMHDRSIFSSRRASWECGVGWKLVKQGSITVSQVIKIRPLRKGDFVVDAAATFLDSHRGGFVIIDNESSRPFPNMPQIKLINMIKQYDDLYDNEYKSEILKEIKEIEDQARQTTATR